MRPHAHPRGTPRRPRSTTTTGGLEVLKTNEAVKMPGQCLLVLSFACLVFTLLSGIQGRRMRMGQRGGIATYSSQGDNVPGEVAYYKVRRLRRPQQRCTCLQLFRKSPADRLQLPNDRILAPPQSNKVRVPTSRTRVMIGERRDRGAGPPAEEDVRTPARSLRDIHRCLGKRRSSSRLGFRGAFGRRGRPEHVRGVP